MPTTTSALLAVPQFYPDGREHQFDYDLAGNRTWLEDATGVSTSTYDSRNLLLRQTNPDGKTVTYSYDSLGRRRTMTDPDGGRFTYSYDLAGRLTGLVNPRGETTTQVYDLAGRLIRRQSGNGAVASYTYDAADRLTVLANARPNGVPVNLFTYAYDAVGNRTSVVELSGDRTTWTYDSSYQLVREARSGPHAFSATYVYDAVGNRTLMVDAAGRTTYTYDEANELLTEEGPAGVTGYAYDESGNRTWKDSPSETTYYTWDEESRLVAAEPPAGVTTLAYSADGRRVRKETPDSQTRKFVYDFQKLLQETDGADDPQREYTFTVEEYGDLLSDFDGSDSSYFQFDGLGSTDALLDESGAEADRYAHRAFGLQASPSGTSDNPFTFVGRQSYYREPELELYLLGARYYDPQAGRFLSEDPLGYRSDDLNLYAYVHNNPVNAADPSGTFGEWIGDAWASAQAAGSRAVGTVKRGVQRAGQAVQDTAVAAVETAKGTAVAVGQGVSYAVSATGKAVAAVGNKVVEGVQLAALETFNQGLKLAGLTPDKFWQVVDQLGDIAKPLISQGKKLVNNFLEALNLGFTRFIENIGKHLLGGLTEWLTGERVTEFKDLPSLLIRILGVAWDQVLGLVTATAERVIGPRALGAILGVVGEVSKFIELGPGQWLEEKKEQISFKVSELKEQVIETAKGSLLTAAIPAVLNWLPKLLRPVGAVFAVAKAIYDAVKWFLDNAARIERLVKTVLTGFRDLVSGASVGQIAERVETTLGGLVAPIFDALAKALGLGSLPKTIGDGLESVRGWIRKKIQSLLEFLFKPLKSLFAKQRKGGVQLTPAVHWTVERKDGTLEEHELWVETSGDNPRDVRIRFSSPREEDAKEFVAKHRKRGKAELESTVDRAAKQVDAIEATVSNLPRPGTGKKYSEPDAKKIGKLRPQLLKQAKELADRIQELQQADEDATTVAPAKTGPIKAGETTTYQDFVNRSVVGDKLEGHELWQHANLKANGLATERLSTAVSQNNPVIALDRATHLKVNAAQRVLDATNMTPLENIRANADILRRLKAAPESVVKEAKEAAIQHAKSLGYTK